METVEMKKEEIREVIYDFFQIKAGDKYSLIEDRLKGIISGIDIEWGDVRLADGVFVKDCLIVMGECGISGVRRLVMVDIEKESGYFREVDLP